MKEKPILFSGPMVRAILDGRKRETAYNEVGIIEYSVRRKKVG